MQHNPSSPLVRVVRIVLMASILFLVGRYIMFDVLVPTPEEMLRAKITQDMVMRREYIFLACFSLLTLVVCAAAIWQWHMRRKGE